MKISFYLFCAVFLFCAVSPCAGQEETVLLGNAQNAAVLPSDIADLAPDSGLAPALETAVFKIRHVPLQVVAGEVRKLMGSSQGGVIVNEESRQLEVSALAQALVEIRALIEKLDQERDIPVDIKIVQVDLNEEHFPGINWSAIVADYRSFTGSEDDRKFSAGTVSRDDLAVLLEALGTVGETSILPVKTVNIKNGQDMDLRLKAFDESVSVTLEPLIGLNAESGLAQDRYSARFVLNLVAGVDNAFELHVLSSDGKMTDVRIKQDGVFVVGGIFTQTKSQSTRKFPFLGDLPLVGTVFRDQSKVVRRLENVIFLVPRLPATFANKSVD